MIPQKPVQHSQPFADAQLTLFGANLPTEFEVNGPETPCDINPVAKRRDGGTRYWCHTHRADATAKYGKPAKKCRRADVTPICEKEILTLDLEKYLGGVALWGAVPAVYDTTRLPMDRGIHVHARLTPDSTKELDWTYRAVRLMGTSLPDEGVVVQETDAIYYMVSSIFGFDMIYVTCGHCGWPHLDKDWFSVHPHRRHLCAGCGKHFHDKVTGIGNPIVGIRDACGANRHEIKSAQRSLHIQQSQYPGGIQIWGSNPAFLWTGENPEEEGIHVHAYLENKAEPDLDDTYSEVTIDGIRLHPTMVRTSMAQNVMPTLAGRVQAMTCAYCDHMQFDLGEAAYVPSTTHICTECGRQFSAPGRKRKTVANPFQAVVSELAKHSARKPQQHRLDLLPETL